MGTNVYDFIYCKKPTEDAVLWFVLASIDGTNDNSDDDDGFLLGRTIASVAETVTVVSGSNTMTVNTPTVNAASVTHKGRTYGIGTVVSMSIENGTLGETYDILLEFTLDDALPTVYPIVVRIEI